MLHAEPGTVSGACFDGAHSPWPRPFAPPTPQQIALPCSPASQLLWPRPTSHARSSAATAPRLPDADRRTRERAHNRRPDVGSPKFRRDPFARDVLFDPGRVDSTLHNGTAHVAFGSNLRPQRKGYFGALSHTPRNRCVRFVFGIAAASRNTRFQVACWALPGPDLHRLIAPASLAPSLC